jgi:hypothetical protein
LQYNKEINEKFKINLFLFNFKTAETTKILKLNIMKKIILISIILFFAGLNITMAQAQQVAVIKSLPAYNYYMTEQSAAFLEQGSGETREKRDMNVVISTSGDAVGEDVFATVYIVKKDGSQAFGPFTVYTNEPFSFDLPKGKWGVTINSNWDLTLSAWISKAGRTLE